jgi:16S rRNA processing protein RimM
LTYSKKTKTEPQASSTAEESGWALLAHLVRPQGRHGEVLADILTDFPERFSERKRLFLIASEKDASSAARNRPPREIILENHWLHKGRIVFKFAGIDSINDADTLRGFDVAIPASERAPLDDGAVYISDLIGCELVDRASGENAIGRVVNVDREASLLVVESTGGAELLIPFTRAYLEKMDIGAKRIEMRLPSGLLEINAPLSDDERAQQRAQESGESE